MAKKKIDETEKPKDEAVNVVLEKLVNIKFTEAVPPMTVTAPPTPAANFDPEALERIKREPSERTKVLTALGMAEANSANCAATPAEDAASFEQCPAAHRKHAIKWMTDNFVPQLDVLIQTTDTPETWPLFWILAAYASPFKTRVEELEKQVADLKGEAKESREEIENLLWNLGGCDAIAAGWSKPHDYNKEMSRPALDTVSRLAERAEAAESRLASLASPEIFLEHTPKWVDGPLTENQFVTAYMKCSCGEAVASGTREYKYIWADHIAAIIQQNIGGKS